MNLPLFIVNDFDRPDHKHLTIRKEDGLLYYIHPELEKWKGMSVTTATPLEAFGITCHYEHDVLHGVLDGGPTATYRDGRPRRWQGQPRFSFTMNKRFQEFTNEALRAGGVI
jgi:hypothetical protein